MSDPLYLVNADALDELRVTAPATIRCCVTSPPYFGLRNYGVAGQIGMERTVTEYVEKLVAVFAEVRRVLTDDGTLWLNLGDSYAGSGRGSGDVHSKNRGNEASRIYGSQLHAGFHESARHAGNVGRAWTKPPEGLKPKDLIGIPWRVAFALQAAGWWLREDIIWHKRNCMPESVRDRCTRSHEYIFHFAKSENYFHNQAAIKEPCIYTLENDHGSIKARKVRAQSDHKSAPTDERNGIRPTLKDARTFDGKHADKQRGHSRRHDGFNDRWDKMEREEQCSGMRNKRSVWTVAPACYPEAHFATFPPKLIEPSILAGSAPGDIVLDPFAGSGTTGQVALEHGRRAHLIELNPDYCRLIRQRCAITPGLPLSA